MLYRIQLCPYSTARAIFCTGRCRTRGWTLQERLASTRILYFMERELVWECQELIRCERLGTLLFTLPELDCARFKRFLPHSVVQQDSNVNVKQDPKVVKAIVRSSTVRWCEAISEYTKRSLTYPTDKLPAISGLASTYFDMKGSDLGTSYCERALEQAPVLEYSPIAIWLGYCLKIYRHISSGRRLGILTRTRHILDRHVTVHLHGPGHQLKGQ